MKIITSVSIEKFINKIPILTNDTIQQCLRLNIIPMNETPEDYTRREFISYIGRAIFLLFLFDGRDSETMNGRGRMTVGHRRRRDLLCSALTSETWFKQLEVPPELASRIPAFSLIYATNMLARSCEWLTGGVSGVYGFLHDVPMLSTYHINRFRYLRWYWRCTQSKYIWS